MFKRSEWKCFQSQFKRIYTTHTHAMLRRNNNSQCTYRFAVLSKRSRVLVLDGGRMLLKVGTLVDARQPVPTVPAQLGQPNAQRFLALKRRQSPIELVRRVELGEHAVPIAELALVLGLAPTLVAAKEVHDELVVAHEPFSARALAQFARVNVNLGELEHNVGVLVVGTEEQRRHERLGGRIVFALKVVAVGHVVQLSGLVGRYLDGRQALREQLRQRTAIGDRVIDELGQLLVGPGVAADAAIQVFADVLFLGVFGAARLDMQTNVLPVAEAVLFDGVEQVQLLAGGPGVFGARQLDGAGRVLMAIRRYNENDERCWYKIYLQSVGICGHFCGVRSPRRLQSTAKTEKKNIC